MRGGVDTPYQKPAGFVNNTQAHIMVTFNWRVGLFGFPGAAGLPADEQNLGVLDARLALEWVHANIAAFGGDPDRVVVWGHSAGGVVADLLSFAYPDNPRAAGFFLHSGLAVSNTQCSLLPLSAWTATAVPPLLFVSVVPA